MVAATRLVAALAVSLSGLYTQSRAAEASSARASAKTTVKLVSIHPHNASAFTEGFFFLDDTIVESTGLERHSFIRQYKLSNPTAVEAVVSVSVDDGDDGSDDDDGSEDEDDDAEKGKQTKIPLTRKPAAARPASQILNEYKFDADVFGEGVTSIGDKIFALTYKKNKVLVLSKADFKLVGTHPFHTSTGEGWGLTNDGRLLIVSDGSSSIQFFDPQQNFKQVRTIDVTSPSTGEKIDQINELEYIEGEIFANVWFKNLVLRIDPNSGHVIETLDFSWLPAMVPNLLTMSDVHMKNEAVMNGIAFNPKNRHVYLTGKLWDSIFEIELSCLKRRIVGKN